MARASEDTSAAAPLIHRPKGSPDIELIRHQHVLPSLRYVSPSYMATLLLNATGRFRYRGRDFPCPRRAVTLLDPEEAFLAIHEPRDASAALVHLIISPEVLLRAQAEAGGAGPVRLAPAPENGAQMAESLLYLEQQILDHESLGVQQALCSLIDLLCANMTSAPVSGVRERRAVARAREILRAQLDTESSLDDLAAEVGLTKAYLVRVFAREIGLPPHEYQMHLRVARATRLLARRVPAGEVAHSVGFYDQSHLNRWFKKVIGVTPGQYAKAVVGS